MRTWMLISNTRPLDWCTQASSKKMEKTFTEDVLTHHFDDKVFGAGFESLPVSVPRCCRINFTESSESHRLSDPPLALLQIRHDQSGRKRIRQDVSVGRPTRCRRRRRFRHRERIVQFVDIDDRRRRRRVDRPTVDRQLAADVDDFEGHVFVVQLLEGRRNLGWGNFPRPRSQPLLRRRREHQFGLLCSGASDGGGHRWRHRDLSLPFPGEDAKEGRSHGPKHFEEQKRFRIRWTKLQTKISELVQPRQQKPASPQQEGL